MSNKIGINHLIGLTAISLSDTNEHKIGQSSGGMLYCNGSFQNNDTINHNLLLYSNIFAGGQVELLIVSGSTLDFKYVPINTIQVKETIKTNPIYCAYSSLHYFESDDIPDSELKIR